MGNQPAVALLKAHWARYRKKQEAIKNLQKELGYHYKEISFLQPLADLQAMF